MPPRELAALSDNDFFDLRSAVFRLAFGADRYARKGSAEGDRAYAAYRRLTDYGYGPMQDMALERLAAQEAAEKAAKKAAAAAKRAATAAKKKAEAGFVGSNYFPASAKVRLGEKVYADEGDVFTVTGVAAGSDPHNEQYATSLIASGLLDKRNHRGNWAVIERGSDALLVSIGKGPKRNPRRRTATRRRNPTDEVEAAARAVFAAHPKVYEGEPGAFGGNHLWKRGKTSKIAKAMRAPERRIVEKAGWVLHRVGLYYERKK
jgi:hypothetical protein